LDPFLHGPKVAELALNEIQQFYNTGMATPAERQFFDQALSKYSSITVAQQDIAQQFKQHIHTNETEYHVDKAGEFQQLWPELATL
jgi:predicted acetyltransferase